MMNVVAGTYQTATNSTYCVQCSNGTASEVDGRTSPCTNCPANYFAGSPGNSQCSPCSAGTFSLAGASRCTQCANGTASGIDGTPCVMCAAGTYANTSGLAACQQCPLGTSTINSRHDSMLFAESGRQIPGFAR